MRRRELLLRSAALPIVAAVGHGARADETNSFDASTVRTMAREIAQKPFQAPDQTLPDQLKNLDYQQYRSIRFDPSRALWKGAGTRFTAEFFHRGYLYKDAVQIYEVANGRATHIRYNPAMFTFDKVAPPTVDIGYAGFRLHYPLNRADYFDEVCAFLGASYFRAVAKNQGYGLSARGLAIKTADPGGEEFPLFKAFWLERPAKGADVIVVHALLDSQSAAAAFRFTIRPGTQTVFDTEVALYPRVDIAQSGIAPLTSMFMFDSNDRMRSDDYRNAVHDTNGLLLWTGKGEQVWRPLANPRTLQISAFTDAGPHGFGLMQRKRTFEGYQDLEAHYENRPSAWIEPIGDWGQGIVELVEIPSDREVNDNVVSFWRPHDPLKAKGEYLLNYRLHWCWSAPIPAQLAKVVATRTGQAWDQKNRLFIIDFAGGTLAERKPDALPTIDLGASKGKIENPVVAVNPDIHGLRLSFQLDQGSENLIEMHARLVDGETPLTETWIYRWTT
ncbi:MAG TPA: glucan biosynthesis protein G [Acetobacteraceae bacterium]|jgi:glucans biosynthesis protein|nr:glucan biosynthesis protein G [Acetobacteraceae bacterium]